MFYFRLPKEKFTGSLHGASSSIGPCGDYHASSRLYDKDTRGWETDIGIGLDRAELRARTRRIRLEIIE